MCNNFSNKLRQDFQMEMQILQLEIEMKLETTKNEINRDTKLFTTITISYYKQITNKNP